MIIFFAVAAMVLFVYLNGYSDYTRNNEKIEVQENLRLAVNKIAGEIRQAVSLEDMSSAAETNLGTASGENPPTHPIYVMDIGKKIIFVITEGSEQKVIGYYLSGGKILRSVNGAGNNPVASQIKDVNFQYTGKTVLITCTGEKSNSGVITQSTKIRPMAL
ncbi:MAG: hypothetical protein XD78_1709 [Desulfotomaculum sp. 46_296]|nr:MAG: hypothetical protein XD78_1709 [Desulfotomaculum sp. 46_296]KUK84625.1 MAG: hypothetical protein XE00_0634 [Desulfofundulus kuznetsovii]HAU32692.1 hypothetical protein [Desulfotomaculum sp.]